MTECIKVVLGAQEVKMPLNPVVYSAVEDCNMVKSSNGLKFSVTKESHHINYIHSRKKKMNLNK